MASSQQPTVHHRTQLFNKIVKWTMVGISIVGLYFFYPYLFEAIWFIWWCFKMVLYWIFSSIFWILSTIWSILTIPWYYWPSFCGLTFYTIFTIFFVVIHIFGQWLFDAKWYQIYYNPHRLLFICLMIYYIKARYINIDTSMLWTHYILHSANTSNWSFKVFSIEVFLKYAIMVHQISSHNINVIANKILPLLFASCYVSSPIAAASRDIIALFIDTKRETAKIFKKYSYTVTVPVLFVIICRSWSNQFRDIYDYLFDVETAFLFYDAWFQQWVSVGIGFTFWFIIGIFGFFKPEIKTDFLKCQKYINGLLIRFVTLYVWYWFINHWISSYFTALLYFYSFCFYKIPVIFLSDLGGIFSEFGTSLGKNLQENKDKLKQDSDDHLFQNKDEIVVYGYFKQYIEHEIDYVFPTEILLEILRFYNIKYSIEWDINNSIDYGKKLLILNEGNTARWSGELADTQQMEANKKGVIAVSNHSIGYLGEDSNLNLKIVDLRFKIRSIINPGYPLVSITFIDEKDLKTVRESPDKMDQVSEMYSYNSMVNRMNVFDDGSIKSFWDIKKLKKKIMKQLNEDDVICLRFDFEKEVAQYYKNDIAQGTEIKISKDTKYKICACLCFQGDDITFV